MFRRATLLLLVLSLLTTVLFPAQAELSNEARYTSAQRELSRYFNGENTKSLDALCADFEALGMYQQSAAFFFYTSILRDLSADKFGQLDMYLTLLRMDPDFCALLQDHGLPEQTAVNQGILRLSRELGLPLIVSKEYDGKEYRAPETKNTKPLRQILSERKKKAGRQLCDACWEKFIHQKRRTKCDLQGTGVFRG